MKCFTPCVISAAILIGQTSKICNRVYFFGPAKDFDKMKYQQKCKTYQINEAILGHEAICVPTRKGGNIFFLYFIFMFFYCYLNDTNGVSQKVTTNKKTSKNGRSLKNCLIKNCK